MISKFDMKVSKFISLVLRHKPEEIGVTLDKSGFMRVSDLIAGINRKLNVNVSLVDLERIVDNDNKKRYSFNDDKTMIRANQGHSVSDVFPDLKETKPPKTLYHGTSRRVLTSVVNQGIKKMSRQYVHLSSDIDTASIVGKRHGELVVLEVDTEQMYNDGFKFFLSENGVWLTDNVPSKYFFILL